MYSNIELTGQVFRAILNNLIEMEENKDEILNEFYPVLSDNQSMFNSLIERYIKKLEELVKTAQIIEQPNSEQQKRVNYLPCVIIGSKVEVEVLKDKDAKIYRLVSPYYNSKSLNDISYLSDLGRALMLKELGEVLNVSIGGNLCAFRIKAIWYEL